MIPEQRWPDRWRTLNHNPEALAKARRALDWSQRRLASEVGISRSHLCEIEAGHRNANPELLRRLAKALHCAPMSLEHRAKDAA
jgi:ribosome-binding protein aMBF1 (putative translation factor)